jgi:hypothetical protein
VQMNFRFVETPELGGTNDAYAGLSWSYSRRESLEHCTRRYFFQYYAHALPDGELKTKVSFLKGVKNRYLRTGEIVHLIIATYFKKLKIGRNLSEDWLAKGPSPGRPKIFSPHLKRRCFLPTTVSADNSRRGA